MSQKDWMAAIILAVCMCGAGAILVWPRPGYVRPSMPATQRTDEPEFLRSGIRVPVFPEYAFRSTHTPSVFIVVDKIEGSRHLYMGSTELKELKITGRIQEFRDGGSMYISTEKGVLYAPFIGQAKWRQQPAEKYETFGQRSADDWVDPILLSELSSDRYAFTKARNIVRIEPLN